MEQPLAYTQERYLNAKTTVDDRALNRRVFSDLVRCMPQRTPDAPLRALELGAGIGTMVERLMSWGALEHAAYTLLDVDASCIQLAKRRLAAWGRSKGFALEQNDSTFLLETPNRSLHLSFEVEDVRSLPGPVARVADWDLLLAHAVLDLIDLPSVLPRLLRLLKPGGLFYFTLNFDGATLFEPLIDPELDAHIETLYHQTMDERTLDSQPSGSSRTGRLLLRLLSDLEAAILSAGASDWVVVPAAASGYPHDEAYFLHHIINTIDQALADHHGIEAVQLEDWVRQRHAQVERSELIFIAHQLDVLGTMSTEYSKKEGRASNPAD
jgi:SAM-dependent methyltransferase